MAASSLYGAATARLLVTVGYPGKSEVQRGLSGLAGALAHFRGKVNADSHQAAEKAVSNTKSTLAKLQDTAQAQQIQGANFERAHQQRYISERLGQFAKASADLNTLTRTTMKKMGDTGLSEVSNKALFDGVASAGDQYQRLERLARNFYSLGIDGEKALIKELEDSNKARQSAIDLIDKEILQSKSRFAKAYSPEGIAANAYTKHPDSKNPGKINWAYTTEGMAATKADHEAKIKRLMAEKQGIQALMKPTNDLLNLTKGLHTATVEGENARQKEIKETEKLLGTQIQKIEELIRQDTEWAQNITANLNTALQNFRGILQQSLVTLTLFYYKINQVVEGIKGFQQELMNAQSIFQTTNETLYSLSNQIVEFGTQFGVSYDNAAKGLYQFASAGLSADDSMKVLNDTLKLSMAVQGDHNTISKLTTQVIFGFGLQMDEATAVTDKFAHAINKSLIEYQDLASAIKFSMPFFVSSGQSLDTLLGALQILTNRALEAGIAGRGLRQALAEFTQHADDNAAAFRQLGVEILDNEGNMKALTDIAHQFNSALGEQATDMEVMMTLMDDLNVRGATAFIHLVQNADEFSAAVDDLANSAGSAHEMAMIQQQGLEAQLTRLRNAFLAPFLLTDEISNSVGVLNRFELVIQNIVADLEGLIYEVGPDGDKMLTDFAINMREGVLTAMVTFGEVLMRVTTLIGEFSEAGIFNISLLKLYFYPLSLIVAVFEHLGAPLTKFILSLYVLNKVLPFNALMIKAVGFAYTLASAESIKFAGGQLVVKGATDSVTYSLLANAKAAMVAAAAMAAFMIPMVAAFHLSRGMSTLTKVILGLAAALAALVVVGTFGVGAVPLAAGLALAGTAIGLFASAAIPETSATDFGDYGMSLPETQQSSTFTGGQGYNSSPSTVYVRKLAYTESNMNQQYEATTSYQAGVTP